MFRAIRRSFTEGIRGMVKNGLMTVTSLFVVTACIFVFGVFLMSIFNINFMTDKMADSYQVDVYISPKVTTESNSLIVNISKPMDTDDTAYEEIKNGVQTKIAEIENVDLGSIKYVSGADRFKDFGEALTNEEDIGIYNTLNESFVADSFEIELKDIALTMETEVALESIENVDSVMTHDEFVVAFEEFGIYARMTDEMYEEVKESVKKEIMKVSNVDTDNIGFVDGKKRFNDFKKTLSEKELKSFEGLPDNLMPDSYTIRIEKMSEAEKTIAALAEIPHVESVENSSEIVNLIESVENVVRKVSIWIIVAFALVSLFIISNTIKLTVHNRRKEINIMKYVGATDSYIRGPFIMEGFLVGILAAVIAFFISRWIYEGLMSTVSTSMTILTSSLGLLAFSEIWVQLLVSYLCLGGVIGAFGSWISVRRYLHV